MLFVERKHQADSFRSSFLFVGEEISSRLFKIELSLREKGNIKLTLLYQDFSSWERKYQADLFRSSMLFVERKHQADSFRSSFLFVGEEISSRLFKIKLSLREKGNIKLTLLYQDFSSWERKYQADSFRSSMLFVERKHQDDSFRSSFLFLGEEILS
jgi:tRNA(Phe) wybutosine-synthesizing methylase Tyw3